MLDPIRAKIRIVVLTLIAFVGGVILASAMEWTAGSHAAVLQTPDARVVQPVADLSEAFVRISESVTPAVVNIQTERPGRAAQLPPGLREFFPFPMPDSREQQEIPQMAGGTGFLITQDGYIMTNNHVIADAERIRVVLQDRREFDARVVGRDPTTDIAVIKIETTGLPVLRLGRSETARVGEWVLAIGNPLGLEFTVTAGIVSAKGRPLEILRQAGGDWTIEDFIQTDAPINPGNSGGPLVNLRGEAIGVNTAIASRTGFYAGYGFAVPMDLARRVSDDLIRYGAVRRGILGVQIRQISAEDAEVYGLPSVHGVLIQGFPGESPGQRAGLQVGDVIVGVEGQTIQRVGQLQSVIATRAPGETVTLDLFRDRRPQQIRVRLGQAPTAEATPEVGAAAAPERERSDRRLGMEIQPITAENMRQLGFREATGVAVTGVTQNSPAWRAGVRAGGRAVPGLRIMQADRQRVDSVEQFQRILAAKRPGEVLSLLLQTAEGQTQIANIRIPS